MSLQRIIWIASFPKSGNTWLRLLLAHYFLPKDVSVDINSIHRFTTGDRRQDFFDRAAGKPFRAESIDQWLAMRQPALRLIAGSKPGHHFVKTHNRVALVGEVPLIPPEVTAAAIYVIRNPFDLCLSYARHQTIGVDEAIELMAKDEAVNVSDTGIAELLGRWDSHIESWLTAPGMPHHLVKYEDMLADTEAEVRKLFRFLRITPQDGLLRRAIRHTRFEELQKQEAKKGFRERPPKMKQFFVSGRAGGWRETLTRAQVARVREHFAPTIERHWPELVDESAALARGAA